MRYADLLKSIITDDESWGYGHNPETEAQSSLLMDVFFDQDGIFHPVHPDE